MKSVCLNQKIFLPECLFSPNQKFPSQNGSFVQIKNLAPWVSQTQRANKGPPKAALKLSWIGSILKMHAIELLDIWCQKRSLKPYAYRLPLLADSHFGYVLFCIGKDIFALSPPMKLGYFGINQGHLKIWKENSHWFSLTLEPLGVKP